MTGQIYGMISDTFAEHVVAAYLGFLLLALFIFFVHTNRGSSVGTAGSFSLMCSSVIFLVAGALIFVFSDHPTLLLLAHNAYFVFLCFFLTAQFLSTYAFYKTENSKIPYPSLLFYFFPVVFAIMALSPIYTIVVEFFRMVQAGAEPGLPVVGFNFPQWELFAWIALIYSYIMLILSFIAMIIGKIRRPKFNQMPSVCMLIALVVTALGVISFISSYAPFGIDPLILTFSLALIPSYIAITTNTTAVFARNARSAAFRFLQPYVIIFDRSGLVVDFNPSASKWFTSIGITLRGSTHSGLIKQLKKMGATISPTSGIDEGEDLTLTHKDILTILNMRLFKIKSRRRSARGSVLFFFDVTKNREMLHKLEKEAGVDPLSGLPNRLSFNGAKTRYDNESYHLPLSVVVGDINNLKITNDTLGHKYGDLLIRTVAKLSQDACKKSDFIARLGGDEFIFLLSRTNELQAQAFIVALKDAMRQHSESFPFPISMAMGTATKLDQRESLDAVIGVADGRMYADKNNMKSKGQL